MSNAHEDLGYEIVGVKLQESIFFGQINEAGHYITKTHANMCTQPSFSSL